MMLDSIKSSGKIGRTLIAAALLAGLSACATPPTDPEGQKAYNEANDPLEPFNRAMFGLNQAIDAVAIKPVSTVYKDAVPDFVQTMVSNFLNNLSQPVVAINALLQGNPDAAGDSLGRFMFNSVAGFGGLFDPATNASVPEHDEDFGQTLAVWGFGEGAYLVLPILGPTSVRDGIGTAVDYTTDPVNYWIRTGDYENLTYARTGAGVIDFRARNMDKLDRLEETSIDFYATIRSIYRQQRKQLINNEELDLDDPAFNGESEVSGDKDLYEDPGKEELSSAEKPETAS